MEARRILGEAEENDDRTKCPMKVNADTSSSFVTGLTTAFV
jgi:hypothetical protein